MNEQILSRLLRDMIDSRDDFPFNTSVKLPQYPDLVFHVRIEAENTKNLSESVKFALESRTDTISSRPAGAKCDCCNGSGKAS